MRDLNQKIEDLEKTLTKTVKKHEDEKAELVHMAKESVENIKKYADRLREEIVKKSKEIHYIKVL